MLRHGSFLEALSDANSDRWQIVSAGYQLLTLIDWWASGAPPRDIHAALRVESREEDDANDWMRPSIREVAHSLARCGRFPDDRISLAKSVHAWSLDVCSRNEHRLGLDLVHVAIEHAADDPVLAWQCHLHCAYVLRTLNNLTDAEAHYSTCAEIGRTIGDEEAIFRGELGFAKIARQRGNLPVAEEQSRKLLGRVIEIGRHDLAAFAHHDIGHTLGLRGRHEQALTHFVACLGDIDEAERDVVLSNIAYIHVMMGDLRAARDAYMPLVDDAKHFGVRVSSRISLIEIFGALRQRDEVEHHKRILLEMGVPADLEPEFWLTLGRAYVSLGDPEAAILCFERSARAARLATMGQYLIHADRALADLLMARRSAPEGHFRETVAELPFADHTPCAQAVSGQGQ